MREESGCSCCWPVVIVARSHCQRQSGEGEHQHDNLERRAERAQTMVMLREVSANQRVLEGAPLAPGTQATLKKLRQRPSTLREPLNVEPSRQPETLIMLDHQAFLKSLKTARRGVAPRLSGMTADNVNPLLENSSDAESWCQVAELLFSRSHSP